MVTIFTAHCTPADMHASLFLAAATAALLAALSSSAAMAATSAACPGAMAETCMGMPMGPSSYASFNNATVDECCAACLKDGTLCYGFSIDKNYRCTLLDAWNASHLHKGACTTAKVNDWPQRTQRQPAKVRGTTPC